MFANISNKINLLLNNCDKLPQVNNEIQLVFPVLREEITWQDFCLFICKTIWWGQDFFLVKTQNLHLATYNEIKIVKQPPLLIRFFLDKSDLELFVFFLNKYSLLFSKLVIIFYQLVLTFTLPGAFHRAMQFSIDFLLVF